MATIDTHSPETINDGTAADPDVRDLGAIVVRRDALQAQARAEALLLTVRAVQHGIAAMRAMRGPTDEPRSRA